MKLLLTIVFFVGTVIAYGQDYLKLGDDCYKRNDYKCAYENYNRLHQSGLNTKNDVLFFRIGHCLAMMERDNEAKRWLHLSLALDNSMGANWELGHCHYNTGRFDSAAIYYVKAYGIATDADDKMLISYSAADVYYRRALYKEARQYIDESLKVFPQFAMALVLSGKIATKEKNYSLAEQHLLKSLRQIADSATTSDGLESLANLKYVQGKYLEALPWAHRARAWDPADNNRIAVIGDVHRYLDNADSADHYYKILIDRTVAASGKTDSVYVAKVFDIMINKRLVNRDTVKALQYMPMFFAYNPGNSNAKEYINVLFVRRDFRSLEAILPGYFAWVDKIRISATGDEVYTCHKKMGDLYRDLKMIPQALKAYNAALHRSPVESAPVIAIVRILIDEKRYKEAADTIQSRLPKVYEGSRNLVKLLQGELAMIMKDTAAAGAVYRDITRYYYTSSNYPAYYYLGQMALQRKDSMQCANYWGQIASMNGEKKEMTYQVCAFMGMWKYTKATLRGDYETAARWLEKAVVIDSTQPYLRLYAGMANINCGQLAFAKPHLQRIVASYAKKKDTLSIIYSTLGYIEMKQFSTPNFETAINYYLEAQKANPKDSVVTNEIGTVYYQQKEYAKAAAAFALHATQVKAVPNLAQAYYNQALCLYMNKQNEEAKTKVNKCLELMPGYAEAQRLKAAIEKPG